MPSKFGVRSSCVAFKMSTNRPPVLHAPAHLTTLSRSFSVIVPSEPYVIGLALLPTSTSTYVVSASPPSNAIYLYTPSPTGLTQTRTLSIGGNGPSTTRVVPNFGGRPTLLSSQQHHGCVKVWDERAGQDSVLECQSFSLCFLRYAVNPE